jgi:hypothetical protein
VGSFQSTPKRGDKANPNTMPKGKGKPNPALATAISKAAASTGKLPKATKPSR